MDPRIDAGDQVVLPRAALDLPSAQRKKGRYGQES